MIQRSGTTRGFLWGTHRLWCVGLSIWQILGDLIASVYIYPAESTKGKRERTFSPARARRQDTFGSDWSLYDLPVLTNALPTPWPWLLTAQTRDGIWPIWANLLPFREFVIRAQRSLLIDAEHSNWGVLRTGLGQGGGGRGAGFSFSLVRMLWQKAGLWRQVTGDTKSAREKVHSTQLLISQFLVPGQLALPGHRVHGTSQYPRN